MLISNDLANFDEKFVKNKSQKTHRKVWWFKRKAYLCTRNRETTMVAKAIFEDIYIIRQVVQESESSISIKSTVNEDDLGLRWIDGIRAEDIRKQFQQRRV